MLADGFEMLHVTIALKSKASSMADGFNPDKLYIYLSGHLKNLAHTLTPSKMDKWSSPLVASVSIPAFLI